MFQRDHWPFVPTKLTEIIAPETLAVLEAGCCERLRRSMAIFDYRPAEETLVNRVDTVNARQRFEPFCRIMRDPQQVSGGNEACRQCDLMIANRFSDEVDQTAQSYQEYDCHMGLHMGAHVIRVNEHPVGLVLAGQFRPHGDSNGIAEAVAGLGTGRHARIGPLTDETRHDLLHAAQTLPSQPDDFATKLAREAQHLERLANAEYALRKYQWEYEFLGELRTMASNPRIDRLETLRNVTGKLLDHVRTFCRCRYVAFYANLREDETVLIPIAQAGFSDELNDRLPHFNWKKAGLPQDNSALSEWDVMGQQRSVLRGIRGGEPALMQDTSFVLPTSLGSLYRGVLLFGPFDGPVHLAQEQRLLQELCRDIGFYVLTELQILFLEERRTEWRSTARLLTHQIRTALTPITTYVSSAHFWVDKPATERNSAAIEEAVRIARDLCLRLGRSVGETVESHVLLLEHSDLGFERYPLSALVTNSAEGFAVDARRRQREIIIEESIEYLPLTEVDIPRLTIAISNVIENAVKYSFPGTKIYIRGASSTQQGLDLETAVIEVQDHGDAIPEKMRTAIFEEGTRALTSKKLQRIPGTGLGLWEARAVIEAHGGTITARSEPTSTYFRHGQAHRVTFEIRLPIRQPEKAAAD